MKDAVILITRFGMGSADEKLQLMVIAKYLELLLHNGNLPSAICFYTDGVRLVCEGSPVIEQLHKLESLHVSLISCSTCLNYFAAAGQEGSGKVFISMSRTISGSWRCAL